MLQILIFILFLFSSADLWAQEGLSSLISPGDLSAAHQKYDGITNCTKCHEMGKGVPDSKCLDCHDKLAERIKKRQGLHAKYTAPCISCHDEHKGRNFKIVSLAKDKFNHEDTGYGLKDKHSEVKCEKCHKKEGIYTGLSRDCITCHPDKHKGQLDRDCSRCHDFTGWKNVERFRHDTDSKYPLTGKHIDIKCAKCHPDNRFKIEKHEECITCHKDPHKGKPACKECHTTEGWKKVKIDHSRTKYPLTNKHQEVVCGKCHRDNRLKEIPFSTCDGSFCHKDPHKNQFKDRTCESCHNTKGWKPSLFEHVSLEYKGFKLDGKHVDTKCEKCHAAGKYRPVATNCFGCHEKDDTHKGEVGNNCEKCHNAESWKKSTLDHNKQTKFPLVGRHIDVKCDKCHAGKKYRVNKLRCADCHEDIHKGSFKEECGACHTQSDWQPRRFDHRKLTGFELKGVHNDISCINCHKVKGVYKGANRYCNQCHVDPHLNQFGSVGCPQCHSESSWNPTLFNHSKTGYPLVGRHRSAECGDCHKNRLYRGTTAACVGCHLSDYAAAPKHTTGGYSRDCTTCHTSSPTSWIFNHSKMAGSTGCASCHLSKAPASHSTNNFGTSCENCHRYPTWDFTHTSLTSSCNTCHSDEYPSAHQTYNNRFGATCESCHKYPSWSTTKFNHSFSSFPTSHEGASRCSDCHSGQDYGNKGGCVDCHGNEHSRGYTNSQCLSCHPTGKED